MRNEVERRSEKWHHLSVEAYIEKINGAPTETEPTILTSCCQ